MNKPLFLARRLASSVFGPFLCLLHQEDQMSQMRATLMATLMLLASSALAGDKPNPADYPEKAHVMSAELHHASHGTSAYNAATGQWTYGSGASNSAETELRIRNLIYTASNICKAAVVGQDYPARLEKNKIQMLVGDKVCKYRVSGVREP
jgi:hypothetical protein